MGIIVLAVAILPMLGVGGMQLLRAEVPGPIKDTKLTARIGDTAAILWTVYLGITVACILALRLAGMGWFDAVCHAFAALALGGFSTRDASIGAFDSPAIEAVLILFMVIAALNFATHYTVWRARSLRAYWRDAEAKGVILVLLVSTLGCAAYLWFVGTYADFPAALRHVAFNLVSLATDCGFVSVDYAQWPIFVPFWMLFLSSVTASSGLHRRRDQDDPHPDPGAPELSGAQPPDPSDPGGPGDRGRGPDPQQRGLRHPGVHLSLLHEHRGCSPSCSSSADSTSSPPSAPSSPASTTRARGSARSAPPPTTRA